MQTTLTESLTTSPSPPPQQTPPMPSPQQHQETLRRSLSLLDIILYGVGCSVGAGIYSLIGIGAELAGPAISLSFFLCGIACVFTSLAYAEFAARIPVAGSAYTYTYLSFGEVWAWLVGWNLTLGYGISSSVVARSWAAYFCDFLGVLGVTNANWLVALPVGGTGYTCSPLAFAIVGVCTLVLVTGAKESTRFNSFMTGLNLTVLAYVLLAGVTSGTVEHDNLTPFLPKGWNGVSSGAGLVFFAYLGFDMVACLSEEVACPQRDMPRGIVGSLLISMGIYVAVSIVVVGMAPIPLLGKTVPVTNALLTNGCCTHGQQILGNAVEVCLDKSCTPIVHSVLYYSSRFVSFGAIFGLTTATFTCLMGQPRIFYRMAHDGLLFSIFAKINPTTQVPTAGTIITGVLVGLMACFIDLEALANMISLGTLQVFTFVNAGVIILRIRPRDIIEKEEDDYEPIGEQDTTLQTESPRTVLWQSSDSTVHTLNDTATNKTNTHKTIAMTFIFTLCILFLSLSINNSWHVSISIISTIIGLVSTLVLLTIPKINTPSTFACPCVPLVPLAGIACNAYMMGSMALSTWWSIGIWLLLGIAVYCGYGRRYSKLRQRRQGSFSLSNQRLTRTLPENGGGSVVYDSISMNSLNDK